jgi:hypothetical protein
MDAPAQERPSWKTSLQSGEGERVHWEGEAVHCHSAAAGAERWQLKCKIAHKKPSLEA